jgi:rubredoxin
MALWRCEVCGYIYDGEEAADKCPKCGALKEAFKKLDEQAEGLILKSRKTNEMHIAISGLYAKVQKWAKIIVKENLDPPCVAIAERVLKDTNETIQAIKAEIESHIKKGKWG